MELELLSAASIDLCVEQIQQNLDIFEDVLEKKLDEHGKKMS